MRSKTLNNRKKDKERIKIIKENRTLALLGLERVPGETFAVRPPKKKADAS